MKSIIFFLFVTIVFSQNQLQATTVEDIVNNPGNYSGEAVTVEGVVVQYVEGNASTTSFYILKGYYGEKIKVNTASSKPEVNKKYRISGIVYIDPVLHQPFISEQSKSLLDANVTLPAVPVQKENNQLLLVIGLLGLLLLAGIIYYLWQKKSQNSLVSEIHQVPPSIPSALPTSMPTTPAPSSSSGSPSLTPSTIKMPQSIPNATLKFVPGKLIIKSGVDKGKVLAPLQAFPTSNGAVITIGRQDVQGERASAHLKIDDSMLTVSRMQAEIIYRNNKVFLKNLSTANYTELDGYALNPNETKELRSGANIKMGELRLQYIK